MLKEKNFTLYFCLITGMFTGSFLHLIQQEFGMLTLDEAINYYAEVHLSYWNSLFHTFFMPITMYGMFTWIPAMLNMTPNGANFLRTFLWSTYIFHYVQINKLVAFYIFLIYSVPFIRSYHDYRRTWKTTGSNFHNFTTGSNFHNFTISPL